MYIFQCQNANSHTELSHTMLCNSTVHHVRTFCVANALQPCSFHMLCTHHAFGTHFMKMSPTNSIQAQIQLQFLLQAIPCGTQNKTKKGSIIRDTASVQSAEEYKLSVAESAFSSVLTVQCL